MTKALETVESSTVPASSLRETLDPEADAVEALKSLREFILSDVGPDAPDVASWRGLEEYIEELCGYGVEKLSREPDDLRATSARLKSDLEEVSCGNYRALIESFECAGAVRDGVADVRARLDQLVEALPRLAEATRQFSLDVVEKQREREQRLRAMTEERAISDILEMPRLMSTLIAAEFFDEALELREYAIKMAAMHPDEKLIINVCRDMEILTQQMILKLLVVLRNPVQLPMCLRVVGFLRRLGVYSEFRLRMLFLQCRGEWMRSGIESTAASTQQAQLVTLSDSTRAMVFEIITQYRAVFNDDIGDDEDELGDSYSPDDAVPYTHSSAILFDWTSSCVTDYLDRLRAGIKDIREGAALNTVLQQAMYCGQSLGRVGADFRSALPPIFEGAVFWIYSSHLNAALRQFEMMIDDNRWAPVGSSALRKERARGYLAFDGILNEDHAVEGSDGGDANEQYDPPVGVLDSPPLAVFLNGILGALNELRLCAPVSLGPRLGKALQEVLINAGEYMSAVGGPGGAFLKRSDRPHFAAMSGSLRDLCVPHAARCLDYCMNRNGLVNVAEVKKALAEVFGETLARVALSEETAAKLNGTSDSSLAAPSASAKRTKVAGPISLDMPQATDSTDINGEKGKSDLEGLTMKQNDASATENSSYSIAKDAQENKNVNGENDGLQGAGGENLIL